MKRMVDGINDGPLKGIGSLTCWSCHRGQPVPPRIPRAAWESIVVAHAADSAGGRASLGLTMGVYAASLGVDCSHCHVSRDWRDASKPAHQTVKVMSTIFELIPTYFDPAKRVPSTQCFMCHQGHIKVEQTDPRWVVLAQFTQQFLDLRSGQIRAKDRNESDERISDAAHPCG